MSSSGTDLSFDLVTTTRARTDELDGLLSSLDDQEHRSFRLLVVDQNDDARLDEILERPRSFPIVRLRSDRGVSKGRNAALPHIEADVVAFPDDDCRYAPDVLSEVADRLTDTRLDGVTGRLVDSNGVLEEGSWRTHGFALDPYSAWYGAVSATIFLRSAIVSRVGMFDERLGFGSTAGPRSGEELDYVLRALLLGARIEFDPSLEVEHPPKDDRERWSAERGLRDGRSLGYILRKHRYPIPFVGRMLIRAIGGAALSVAHGDARRARFHAATLNGRLQGWVAGQRSEAGTHASLRYP